VSVIFRKTGELSLRDVVVNIITWKKNKVNKTELVVSKIPKK